MLPSMHIDIDILYEFPGPRAPAPHPSHPPLAHEHRLLRDLSRRYLDDGSAQSTRVLKRPVTDIILNPSTCPNRSCLLARSSTHPPRQCNQAPHHAPADRTASWTVRTSPRSAPHVDPSPRRRRSLLPAPISSSSHSHTPSIPFPPFPSLSFPPHRSLANPSPTGYNHTKSPPHLLPFLHAAHSVPLARRHATLQKVVLTDAQAAPLPVWTYWRRPHAAGVDATLLVLLPRAGELDGANPARGGAGGDADAREAGTDDDEVRLDLATNMSACLGSWVPGTRDAASSGGWLHHARAAAVLVRLVAAVLVRLAGRDPARQRWMKWTRGMCGGGRARTEGADMARGRAACGGGRARSGAGACGGCGVGDAVARQERADAAHKDGAWVYAAHFDEHVVREEARERHIRSKTRTSRSSSARVAVLLSEEGLVAEYRHGRDVVREEDWTRVKRIAVEPTPGSSAVEPTSTPLDALPEAVPNGNQLGRLDLFIGGALLFASFLSTVIKLVESDYGSLISCPREQLSSARPSRQSFLARSFDIGVSAEAVVFHWNPSDLNGKVNPLTQELWDQVKSMD
ncbi:hypothetical protein C8J57DRAFT_1475358 [Mycena rebaudengoi]|nr:hypothetical protein C8J57DRAFT_1475358 [Mycena rebaudengoi]